MPRRNELAVSEASTRPWLLLAPQRRHPIQGGTPTSLIFSRISQFQGSIKRAGSPVGNLTGASVTYSNNLEKIETIRDDGLIEGADPTIAAFTGRIDVRFADTTLIDLAAGGSPVDLELRLYALGAGEARAHRTRGITLNDGSLFTVRLLQCDLGADLVLAWQTVVQDSASYTVAAVPAVGLNHLPRIEPVSSEARLFMLDIPLLSDLAGFYWAAGAYADPPWRAAVLFAGDDGALFAAADETLQAVPWGIARDPLPDTDIPFQTDRDTQLRVSMISGALTSVSELAMLNGANRAALIRADGEAEIIAFRDAVLEDGVYVLSTLLRGRRGTEVFTGGHAAGDVLVLLDGAAVVRRAQPLLRLGDTLWHRIVGRGGELRDAPTIARPLLGRDLMPYGPVHLQASGSWGSDIPLSWRRRTRVGGALVDGTGVVPLAEDAEAYEVEILDAPGGTVLRTETVSETSFVYTTAMQGSDFGAAQTELTLRVCQISAQVGRGFPGERTVEIP